MAVDTTSLKSVFEALDCDNQGYISVDQFVSSFENFENSKELSESLDSESLRNLSKKSEVLREIIRSIDPQNDGKIYFDDFVKGIIKLFEIQGLSSESGSHVELENHTEQEEEFKASSETLVRKGRSTTVRRNSSNGQRSGYFLTEADNYSTEDSGVQSVVGADSSFAFDMGAPELDDEDSAFSRQSSVRSDRYSFRPDLDTDGESGSLAGMSIRSDGAGQQSNGKPHVRNNTHPNPGDLLLPPSPNGSTLTRGGEIRSTWPRRQRQGDDGRWKATSAQREAHELRSRDPSERGSPQGSHTDLMYDDLDTSFGCITDQLKRLEQKVEGLQSNQSDSESRESRLRGENQVLVERVMTLEEQLRDVQLRSSETVGLERQHLREKLTRVERDKNEEIEQIRTKLHSLEDDLQTSRSEAVKIKIKAEKYKQEKIRAHEQLEDAEFKLSSLREEITRERELKRREIESLREERDRQTKILDDLSGDAGNLRFGSAADRGLSSADMLSRYREIQELVGRLTQENKRLREQLEEAQAELLTKSLEEGRTLIRPTELSLAAEMDNYSKDELLNLLAKEKEANFKLREYIEVIITKVMEKHPSILEISHQ